MNTVPWNEIKWAKANAEIGLKRDEICPGLTLDQHAESVAMFEMRNTPANNGAWQLTIPVLAGVIKKKLMSGLTEEDIESREL